MGKQIPVVKTYESFAAIILKLWIYFMWIYKHTRSVTSWWVKFVQLLLQAGCFTTSIAWIAELLSGCVCTDTKANCMPDSIKSCTLFLSKITVIPMLPNIAASLYTFNNSQQDFYVYSFCDIIITINIFRMSSYVFPGRITAAQ